MKGTHRSEMVNGEENLEWVEQHHRNFSHRSIQNISQTQLSQTLDSQSGDESDSAERGPQSHLYAPDPLKRTKEYHIEQAIQAIKLLKAASKPTGWKKVLKHKSGCLVYQSTGNGDKQPTFKGEHVIRGYRAQDVFTVVGVRKLWDDWYDELSYVESYDDATKLMYMVMKSNLSSKTRDISMVERIEMERDGTIYFASCSVDSSKIPRISGKVRADIFIAGWIIQPLPSNPPITKITYIIQTDLLNRLPKFIARRSLAKRPLVITTIETHLRKNGVPMVMSNLVSQTTHRHRSLSEPLKPEKFLFPEPDNEDVVLSGSAFLSPLGPIDSEMEAEQLNDRDDSGDEEFQFTMDGYNESSIDRTSRNSLAPSLASNRALAPSIFTPEFLENNARLGDTALFGDSQLFGKGGIMRHHDEMSVTSNNGSRSHSPQPVQTPLLAQERARPLLPPQSSRTLSSGSGQLAQTARSTSSQRNTLPMSAERPTPPHVVTPATPPLTPTTSIDGKDAASDSDASVTSRIKTIPRTPKHHVPVDTALTSRPSSMAFAAYGMRSPSDIMEARRHSTLIGRSASFAPRHSHVIPLRNNTNVTLHGLTRMSSYGALSNAMKRNSTATSVDSNRSSTQLASSLALPHRHSETARKALAMFKVLASSPEDRWRTVSSDGTFKSYSRIISGAGLPMLRGEGVITGGWSVEQINAVIESSGCRQAWDERFENMSIAETFNSNEYLFHITLKGIGSLTGRDLAGVTIIDRDPQTSALYNVSTSVLDTTIPEDPGRIRALLELSGWSLRPIFDGQGNTVSVNVTYVIQIDIRGTLPNSVVKSISASMMTAVPRLNHFMNKTGYPPYASHIAGNRLFDTFDPKTGHFELCFKAAPGWTEIRVGRKVYREGYDVFIKPDDPSVRVELAPDFGGVRIFTTLDHEGQSIVAQVTRKGLNAGDVAKQNPFQFKLDDNEDEDDKPRRRKQDSLLPQPPRDSRAFEMATPTYGGPSPRKSSSHLKSNDQNQITEQVYDGSSADAGGGSDLRRNGAPSSISRKRRSASYTTLSAFDPNLVVASSSERPDVPPQAPTASMASQESERSRSRSRTPHNLVSAPGGAPAPSLPRRSSSLGRHSIPISPYLSQGDAPPLPFSTSSMASPNDNTRTRDSLTDPNATMIASPETTRTLSPMCSPTLGPFHIPHMPIEPVAPLFNKPLTIGLSPEIKADLEAVLPQEAISASLFDSCSTESSILQPAGEISPCPLSPESGPVIGTFASTAAVISPLPDTIAFALAQLENADINAILTKATKTEPQDVDCSLASMNSPLASPLPAQTNPTDILEPSSDLKHTNSTDSTSGSRRVTFSPDVVDNSENRSPPTRIRKNRKRSISSATSPLSDLQGLKVDDISKDDNGVVKEVAASTAVEVMQVVGEVACFGTVEVQDEQEYESDEAEFVEAQSELYEETAAEKLDKNVSHSEFAAETVVFEKMEAPRKSASTMEMDHLRDYEEVWQTAIELFVEQLKSMQVQVAALFVFLMVFASGVSLSISL
ncbi:hypothetical protein BGZ58_008725 [Dissophora ornata]|nr:hypothetical protein BGZ58_008725 [Dissophora ornata]